MKDEISIQILNTDAANRNTAYNIQCKKLKAQAIENIGSAMYYEHKGIDTLRTALKLWDETGDKQGMASAYLRIAELFTAQGNNANALKYCDTSLNLYTQANDKNKMGYIYYKIALNHRYMGNYGMLWKTI
ncbi:MAG: tetratricopeptide repeat protein [Chitinophagaceae bacterium]